MATRNELEVHDPETNRTYYIPIVPGENGGKLYTLQTVTWEPIDGSVPWRVPIHPWDAGLGPNRISPAVTMSGNLANRPSMVYAKANIDASNANYITAPPKKQELGSAVIINFYNSYKQLYYGGSAYGTTTYMGAVGSSSSDFYTAVRNFNGKAYFGGGQYLVSVDASYNYTVVKDFGAGKIIYDIEPFNNELIIAMGPSEFQWKMTAAEVFAQSGDVYSLALAAVDDLLWRAHTINLVSSCETLPNSAASYAADYSVGNTSYSITNLGEYGGVLVVFRPDGVFFPDGATVFHNQTPQLRDYPHTDNGRGWWVGWGNLYVPSIAGLLEVTTGSSFVKGPELAQRPDFRMRVRAGVEWNGAQYLICTDEAELTDAFVCKMVKDTRGISSTPYIYHEWNRLNSSDKSYIILVFTVPVNPTMFAGRGSQGLYYWLMGRGSGPDVDDANYILNTSYELESGDFIPTSDRSIENTITGVKITGKQPSGSTIEVAYSYDSSTTYLPMLDTQSGGGTTLINTPGFFNETRYAPANTKGHVPRIKISGTLPAGTSGPNRPEIYECWVFGESHPETTEIITLGIYNSIMGRVNGIAQGSTNALELFKNWGERGTQLLIKIPGYAEKEEVIVTVNKLEDQNLEVLKSGQGQLLSSVTKLALRRIDFQGVLSV